MLKETRVPAKYLVDHFGSAELMTLARTDRPGYERLKEMAAEEIAFINAQ